VCVCEKRSHKKKCTGSRRSEWREKAHLRLTLQQLVPVAAGEQEFEIEGEVLEHWHIVPVTK
jgi:hypothetical protein